MTAADHSHSTPVHLDRTKLRIRWSLEPGWQRVRGNAAASRTTRCAKTSSPARFERQHSAGAAAASQGMSQPEG